MRRPASLALVALIIGSAGAAHAADLQLAVVFDTSRNAPLNKPSQRLLFVLDTFERTILDASEGAELAIVECGKVQQFSSVARGIGDRFSEMASRPDFVGCAANVDVVEAAIEQLKWREGADKRILVIGKYHSVLSPGRTTAEDVVHRAERNGIVVSALEVIPKRLYTRPVAVASFRSDVVRFLERPLEPLGRVPVEARHAVELSGGTYRMLILEYDGSEDYLIHLVERYPGLKFAAHDRLGSDLDLARAFGPSKAGRDALDDLAEGRRRPSEVSNEELPKELIGIDLEPLLDAVWDYVDARRAFADSLGQCDASAEINQLQARNLGEDLAHGVLAARRLPPSRR